MGSSLQGIAFRSVYNKKWISLVTSFYGRDCYVACKDTRGCVLHVHHESDDGGI